MSTLVASNLKNASATNPNIVLNTDGTIGGDCLTQTCRAWVNFNGTATVAIRASYNVSSITDNATGNFSVNFTTAMPDANYAALATSNDIAWGSKIVFNSYLTTAVTAKTYRGDTDTFSDADPSTLSVAIFR
jgi:hypothetical protein